MAKIIRNTNGEFAHYHAGVIYDIGYIDQTTNTRIPFYVGETSNFDQRLKDHQRAGKNADATSTLVYQTIKEFNEAGITWTMEAVTEFGKEGPTDLEDEWIMRHLYNGHKLTNMKKGNANWMSEREAAAKDMRLRKISSYRKYREVISKEEQEAKAAAKHAKWVAEEEQRKELERIRIENERERDRLAKQRSLRQLKELERQEQLKEQQRLNREKILQETAKVQAEKIRQQEILKERMEKAEAEKAAKWEADRPAREARIKAENERLEEKQRLEAYAEDLRRQERNRLRDEQEKERKHQENIFKELLYKQMPCATEYYKNCDDADELYDLTTAENAVIRKMMEYGHTPEQVKHEIELERRMIWYSGKVR